MTAVQPLRDYYYKEMKAYSQFTDLAQFNQYTKKLRYNFKDKLNTTDYTLIDFLAKHAVKAATGVACPKVLTIAKAIDRSIDTVGRIVRKLEKLGIIKRVYNMRIKHGGNGANFYVFQKEAIKDLKDPNTGVQTKGCENNEKPVYSKDETKKNNCKSIIGSKLQNNVNNIDKDKEEGFLYNDVLDSKKIHMRLAGVFSEEYANKLWRRIIWAFKNSELYIVNGFYYLQDLIQTDADLETRIANTIGACTEKYKRNLVNKTFEGYLYKAMLNLFNNLAVKILEKQSTSSPKEISLEEFFSQGPKLLEQQQRNKELEEFDAKEFYGEDWTLEI